MILKIPFTYPIRLLILSLFLCAAVSLQAQRSVCGTVYDELGTPVIGAIVAVQEHPSVAAVTDSMGQYRLQLPSSKSCTLEAFMYGYDRQSRKVTEESSGRVDFQLTCQYQALDMVVITGTRTPKLLKDAPIITRVITSEEIQQLDASNMQDLLQTELPGIEFTYSMNQQVSLNMQGFGGTSVLFLIDGERLAGETLDNIDYSRLTLDNIARIEIVKGSASSLYGSNAVGGVVNIITKRNKKPWSLNLNGHYGSHNQQRYGGSVGFNAGSFNNMLTAQYASCAPITLKNEGDFGSIYGYHSLDVKDCLTYSYKNKLKLTARAGYFIRERATQEMAHERYRDFSGGLKGDWHLTARDDVALSYTFDQYDKSDFILMDRLDVRDYSNVQHSLRTVYNHIFRKKHTLTVGGDYMRDYLMSYQFENHGAHYQHTADVFTQFDWNPYKRFNIVAALRYDYFSESGLHHISPKLNLMYKFKHFSLRASYANGFRAPTLKEMYMNFDMANIFMIYGNKDLRPEVSHNVNLAAEFAHGDYNVTAQGFYNRVRDRITTVWNQDLKGMVYTNMSPLHVTGVDVSASTMWKFGLAVRLSYVFTKEIIQRGEPEISTTRPHMGIVRLCYAKQWKKYGFSVVLSGRVLSGVTCEEYTSLTSFEETERVTYPAYTIWKFAFNQHIMKGLHINLGIDNLFNYIPEYYFSNSPATTGITFSAGISVDVESFFNK